jgi:hypothetical protein
MAETSLFNPLSELSKLAKPSATQNSMMHIT